jgi:signal transduction histidine kinase
VSLALQLQLVKTAVRSDAATAESLLAQANDELAEALGELRELARGIHPAALTTHGLQPALDALTHRAPIPIQVTRVPAERLPERVEAAIYYLVAEAIANTLKYAHATQATVTVEQANGNVSVVVADDGVGGAEPGGGTGLVGLVDRIEALDGRLRIESPRGHGTRISAVIPCD